MISGFVGDQATGQGGKEVRQGGIGRASAESWQTELLTAYTSLEDLLGAGFITPAELAGLTDVASSYRIRLPRSYAALIDRSPAGRDRCPIRRQTIPAGAERDPQLPAWAAEWSRLAFGRERPWTDDAIGDLAWMAAPRLTHRYAGRAILHLSSACAMYCRFCFRKAHLNDAERKLYAGDLEPALAYLAAHSEIGELILTGGDPLSLSDAALARLLERLESVSHLRHVRLHSRMAATLPSRLTDGLTALLARERPFTVSLASHFNHATELTPQARARLTQLRRAGVALYNQTVLLRGVNDELAALETLFQRLYELGVRPFHLHHPDWTPGTFHFRLPISRGRELMRALRGRLSGPALPDYVLDLPGGGGKIPLTDDSWARQLESREDDGLAGALYEVQLPDTRARGSSDGNAANRRALYADFWKR